jgi:DNA recombination protein RmuC
MINIITLASISISFFFIIIVLSYFLINLNKKNKNNKKEISDLNNTIRLLEDEKLKINTELSFLKEKENILNKTKDSLSDTFKALSLESLENNSKNFINLANEVFHKYQQNASNELSKKQTAIEELIKPVKDTLNNFDKKILDLEKDRVSSFTSLNEHINNLLNSNILLKKETNNLIQALRTPQVKGRWGEEQLRKLVELAGMLNYCDFQEQVSSDDRLHRPDLIIKLPGGKNIIVDAKVSTEAYMDSLSYTDEETIKLKLKEHARQIKEQIFKLRTKAYWEQFDPSPEFVVMFIPGENFFSAALQAEPSLLEESVKNKVILASPTTLLSLLKVINYGWKQELISENTKQIGELSKELYDRLSNFIDNFYEIGTKINQLTDLYNKTSSSFEKRVLVSGRKLELLLKNDKPLKDLKQLDKQAKIKN